MGEERWSKRARRFAPWIHPRMPEVSGRNMVTKRLASGESIFRSIQWLLVEQQSRIDILGEDFNFWIYASDQTQLFDISVIESKFDTSGFDNIPNTDQMQAICQYAASFSQPSDQQSIIIDWILLPLSHLP